MSKPQSDRGSIGHRVIAVAVAMLVVAAVDATPTAAAGQATPAAGEAVTPRPEECQIAPRPLPLLTQAAPGRPAATPAPLASPTPFVPAPGEPADAATTVAITATVREALACRNAGDYARAYALMTDAMLLRLFGSPETLDPIVAAALAAPPDRLPRGQRLSLVAVADVRLLPDGRAAARVETANAETAFVDELNFVQSGDRWLIDQATATTL